VEVTAVGYIARKKEKKSTGKDTESIRNREMKYKEKKT